ncbi:hypothetical protein P7C70_g2459, partial [Phenoliferia sp. Uapishka_3]
MPGLAPEAEGGPSLNDLFADEPAKPTITSAERKDLTGMLSDVTNPLVMLTYYRNLFPFKQLFLWLNQDTNPKRNFTHREFALTLQNEVYIRYNSFTTADDLKREICRQNPARFEIGPVYSGKPKDRKTLLKAAFKPQMRELVFDIDMTDYDEIRTCCKDKAMCKRCWRFISMAVKVLDRALREDFGFNHLLWVYSGRRGIHCWISDPAALILTDEQRKAIVSYLEVIKADKKNNIMRPLHPSIASALAILRPWFASVILADQDCFKHEEQWQSLLRTLPDKDVSARLMKKFPPDSNASSKERWDAVRNPEKKLPDKVRLKCLLLGDRHFLMILPTRPQMLEKYSDAITDAILQWTYPRIDIEVSKKLNHLLKSPFCIHPGTGRVCVPLLASNVESFDPDTVPTVGSLLMELEDAKRKDPSLEPSWEHTSLKPFVELFEDHCKAILKETKGSGAPVKREMGAFLLSTALKN